jgi:hypothetical protein
MEADDGPQDADGLALERELTMVRGAIAMVGSGRYRSMTLGGLSHGRTLLDRLTPEAEREDIELVPLETAHGGPDIRVRARVQAPPRVVR